MAIDWDSLLSYRTYHVVKINDRRLGLIHYTILLGIFTYIGVYVFWQQGGYYESAVATGAVALKLKGMTYSGSASAPLVWSAEDLIWPPIEEGATFVATNIVQTDNQTRGQCGVPGMNCTTNADCPRSVLSPGLCSNGWCQMIQWCPAENITDTPSGTVVGSSSQLFTMASAASLTIWMKATMSFPSLSTTVNYSTVSQPLPITSGPSKNLYSLAELLALAGTNASDPLTINKGAILLVTLDWVCYISSPVCLPTVKVTRLDNPLSGGGFNMRTVSYTRDGSSGLLMRDLYKYTGIRVFIVSTGRGYMVSVAAIVLQLSSALAMTAIATAATDFILQYIMPERARYKRYKVFETEDFVDGDRHAPSVADYGSIAHDPTLLPILQATRDDQPAK
eukprot:TRINITY_DN12452_c0_g1_i1.p1 TRINITY_DN12452_c0_g1~~TRINITY_DN12452_c0_g1_i1.p1  ORF type:complete len:393 (-),score=71.11 TRINITY_DN12452_c0_g1_i1:114-1292(-)